MKSTNKALFFRVLLLLFFLATRLCHAQQQDSSLATPLMWAAYQGNLPLFKQLVKQGADYRKKGLIYLDSTREGYYGNIMGIAAAQNDTLLLLYCLDSLKLNCNDPEYNAETKQENGWLPVHWAASRGHLESMRILVRYGADVGAIYSESGKTPLLYAAEKGHYRLMGFLLGQPGIGKTINVKNRYGWQALHYVCRDINSVAWLEALAEKGAQLNEQPPGDWTPLMLTAINGRPHSFVALLAAGADTSLTDIAGKTVRQMSLDAGRYDMVLFIDRYKKGAKLKELVRVIDSVATSYALYEEGDSCRREGSSLQAIRFFKERLTILGALFGIHHPLYKDALTQLAHLLRHQKSDKARLIIPEGHANRIVDLDYSSDGKYLVSASLDKTAIVWEVNAGRVVHVLRGHKEALTSARFSGNNNRVVTTARDAKPAIWDVASGNKVAEFKAQLFMDCYCEAAFSKDGKTILTPLQKSGAGTFDAGNGRLIKKMHIDTTSLYITVNYYKNCQLEFARYTPDNNYVITGSNSNVLYIWDAHADTLLRTLSGHTGVITSVQVSANSMYVLTTSADSSAKIWSINSGSVLRNFRLNDSNAVIAAAMSADNRLLVLSVADSTLIFYNLQKNKLLRKPRTGMVITSIVFSDDGKQVATIGDGHYVSLWDAERCNIIAEKKYEHPIDAIIFRPDGNELALASSSSVFLLSTFNLAPVNELGPEVFDNNILAVSPQGTHFISTAYSTDFSLRVWDITQGVLAEDISEHTDMVRKAVYSNDGKFVVSCSYDGTIKIWNTGNWQCINTLKFEESASLLRFGNDGKYLAAAFDDGYIRIWKTASMEEILSIREEKRILEIAFGPAGSILLYVLGNGKCRAVDIQTKKQLFETEIKKPWAAVNYAQVEMNKQQDHILLACFGNLKVVNAKTWKIEYAYDAEYLEPIVARRFGRTYKEVLTLHADEHSSLMHLDTDSVEHIAAASQIDSSNIGSHRRSTTVTQGIAATPDWKYIITLNDSLRIIDFVTKQIILQAKADDFVLMDSGRVVLYNNRGRFFAYSIPYKEDIAQLISMNRYLNGYVTILKNGYFRGDKNSINKLSYAEDNYLFSLSQFDIKYNRPDEVLTHLQKYFPNIHNSKHAAIYRKAYVKRLSRMDIDTAKFGGNIVYPVCEVVNANSINSQQNDFNLNLKIFAFDSLSSLHSFNVLVNDVPVYGRRGINIDGHEKFFDTTVTIKLTEGVNVIKPFVVNKQGFESNTGSLRIRPEVGLFHHYDNYSDSLNMPPIEIKVGLDEDIYFIGIGTDQFANRSFNLQWSVKDVRDLALKLKSRYPKIKMDTLFNESVTLGKVKALKQKLLALSESDKVIIAFSGHGILNRNFDYYLSTYDINFNQPEKRGLPYEELENLLDSIKPRQKILLLDACHSGEVDKEGFAASDTLPPGVKGIIIKGRKNENAGLENSFLLMQTLFMNAGRNVGATIIAAAAGTQYAYEKNNLKNGVFTFSILEALDKYKSLSVQQLKRIVDARVPQLTNNLQKPSTRGETMNHNWNIW